MIYIMFYMVAVFIIIYIILYLVLMYVGIKEWNKGVCPKCGKPWAFYYSSNNGDVTYVCEKGHICNISNKIINRMFMKSKKED